MRCTETFVSNIVCTLFFISIIWKIRQNNLNSFITISEIIILGFILTFVCRRQKGIVIERRGDKREQYLLFGQLSFKRSYFLISGHVIIPFSYLLDIFHYMVEPYVNHIFPSY